MQLEEAKSENRSMDLSASRIKTTLDFEDSIGEVEIDCSQVFLHITQNY
jgi:hypothetical protein